MWRKYPKPRIVGLISATLLAAVLVINYGRIGNDLRQAEIFSDDPLSTLWNGKSVIGPIAPSLVNPKFAQENPKVILFWTKFFGGRFSYFGAEGERLKLCPVSNCILTEDRSKVNQSDALIFHPVDADITDAPAIRLPDQYWIYFVLESPMHVGTAAPITFNLTFTYRHDSDIVADNYLQFFNLTKWSYTEVTANVKSKNRDAAVIFASNCYPSSGRQDYISILKKYFPVDVYGGCGDKECPKDEARCEGLVKEYKFYLAFENSICKDYVTEKVIRAYNAGTIPVVMGGANYSAIFPPQSFINVMDFASPKLLAEHLKKLAGNQLLYEKYFTWRTRDRFTRLPDYLSYEKVSLCKLCEMLHWKDRPRKTYDNLEAWWGPPGICREGRWSE